MRGSSLLRGTLSLGSEWCAVFLIQFGVFPTWQAVSVAHRCFYILCVHMHTCRYAHITYIHGAFCMLSSLLSACWALHILSCSVLWLREYSVSAGRVFLSPDWLCPQCLGAYFQPPNQSFRHGRALFCSAFMHVFHRQLKKKLRLLRSQFQASLSLVCNMWQIFFFPPVWISSFLHII